LNNVLNIENKNNTNAIEYKENDVNIENSKNKNDMVYF
jgi:hypothetical protein